MLEEQKMRVKCRRCETKLDQPTSNDRSAFCCRGCFRMFYDKRCLVCEAPMERKSANQQICGKRKCRNHLGAMKGYHGMGKFLGGTNSLPGGRQTLTDPIKQGVSARTEWRLVAGPSLTAAEFRCATVPDGPNLSWSGGSFERIEAENRKALIKAGVIIDRKAERAEIEANGYFTEPHWQEVVSSDGVRCYVARS